MQYLPKKLNKNGFTMIEMVVTIAILMVVTIGTYSLLNYTLRMIREKSHQENARSIANAEMEYLRSLDFNAVGVDSTNCYPTACTLADDKTVTKNGLDYRVLTDIVYFDDPFDGLQTLGTDTSFNDYKKARIEVIWPSTFSNNSLVFESTFAPVGLEENCGGGILKITVMDANALTPVQIPLYIKNTSLATPYDYRTSTDINGQFLRGCLTADSNHHYEIIVNDPSYALDYNENYSTDQTCPTGTGTPSPICPTSTDNVSPTQPHINIIAGGVTEKTFYIDLLSTLNIKTIRQNLPSEWSINQNIGDGKAQDMPTVGIGPANTYYFFWRGEDTSGNPTRIFGQKYNSSKVAQWGSDVQISTANDQVLPNVVVGPSGDAYLAWEHNTGGGSGNQNSYLEKIKSSDGSSLWGSDLNVNTPQQNKDQTNPQINLEDGENFFYVTFLDNSNDTNDIYTTRLNTADISQLYCDEDNTTCSSQGSACGTAGTCTKWSGETKINNDANGNIQSTPKTLTEATTDNLYITWHDNRNGNQDIFAQKIKPNGAFDTIWNTNIQINETNNQEQSYPAIAQSNESGTKYLYFVWQDFRNSTDYDIYLAKYTTAGARVWASDIEVTTKDTTNADQTIPTIAITSDNKIYIAWIDERNSNPDIYLQQFNTDGVAQWNNDFMVNYDQNVGSEQGSPKLIIDNSGQALITWQDEDSGDFDIKAATFGEPSPTNIDNVPLRIYGTKTIGQDDSSNPIYKFDTTGSSNISGELNLNNIEWDIYNITINNNPDYTILRAEPQTPITISPNTTNTITLTIQEN